MKKLAIAIVLIIIITLASLYTKREIYNSKRQLQITKNEIKNLADNHILKEGDLIFQTSTSRQSKAIQIATKSKFSHCGIIFKDATSFYVFEAVQPVKKTSLNDWIARGKNGKFVVKRLKNARRIITPQNIDKMKLICNQFTDKEYDKTFEWSDDKMYCSELIWKIYKKAIGIEIGELEQLKDFDLSSPEVKKIMIERYGDNIPYNEKVISPISIFNCNLLETVKEY
ncbi:MAG: YiiX family permuted papain-like enzyme [Bacteroidota bacterium]